MATAGGAVAGIFSADMDFSQGQANSFANTVDLTGVQNPAPQVVYQSYRAGSNKVGFTYTIPNLPVGGNYLVRLHFAEPTATSAGARVFNVALNGTIVLPNFDIFRTAGAQFKAVVQQFMTAANSTGSVVVAYTYGTAGDPLASGLEIIPIKPGISIDSGGAAAGAFVADTDFVGGHPDTFKNAVNTSAVTNPAPLAVYQSKRTGNGGGQGFTYTIPNLTLGHVYTVRLHFVESATNKAGGRVFNVAINGGSVLKNFDIFKTAGAAYKANVQQFSIMPDAAGKISIAYTYGSAGNPLSSGIEVIP